MLLERWSDGIFLVDRYSRYSVGCWLLIHNGECAVLECPPHDGRSPVADIAGLVDRYPINLRYILCSHSHYDHFYPATANDFRHRFPAAQFVFQRDFHPRSHRIAGVHYFDTEITLWLGGEPLHLVHAPKHNMTDTHVIFRGAIFSGDWALNTLRSVNTEVPAWRKLESIERLRHWRRANNYHIHSLFSTHANDRRHNIDFERLLDETRVDRRAW